MTYQVGVEVTDKERWGEDNCTAGVQTVIDVHKCGAIVLRPCGGDMEFISRYIKLLKLHTTVGSL